MWEKQRVYNDPENVIWLHQGLLRRAIPITTDPGMLGTEGAGLRVTVLSQHGTRSYGTRSALRLLLSSTSVPLQRTAQGTP